MILYVMVFWAIKVVQIFPKSFKEAHVSFEHFIFFLVATGVWNSILLYLPTVHVKIEYSF